MSTNEDLRAALGAGRDVALRRWATRVGATAMLTALAATAVPAGAFAHESEGQASSAGRTATDATDRPAKSKRHKWSRHHHTIRKHRAVTDVAPAPTGTGQDSATEAAPAAGLAAPAPSGVGATAPAPEPATASATPAAPATGSGTPAAPATGSGTPAAPATGSGTYALPTRIVMCESGGNYRAVNPTNPDRPAGAYQIITSTWLAYGGGKYAATADLATPAQQDEIAAKIWNGGAGAGAWACK